MRKQFTLFVMVILLFAVSGSAQSRRKQPNKAQAKSEITDIRQVDFLNYTYQSRLCSQEIPGISKTVRVRKGEFENDEVRFGVDDVIYGDITGDGREEAIVEIGCMLLGANGWLSDIFIYTLKNGRAALVAELNDNNMYRDYKRYYSNGTLWRITDNGVKVKGNNLVIERFAEGSHAAPKYVATMDYRLNGTKLTLSGKPQRRNTNF